MPTNADGTMPFRQNSNLLYLSGIDQEESILVIAPDFPDPKLREVLFVKETSEMIAIWEGHKYTKAEAREASGVQTVMWTSDFEKTLSTLLAQSEYIYLDSNEHIRSATEVKTRNDRFVKHCREQYPLFEYERLAPIIYDLRQVKEPREIELIQKAGTLLLSNQVAAIPLTYPIKSFLLNERVKQFSVTPFGTIDLLKIQVIR